jgi:predicted esterase YcpF (UPF0227 family)
VLVFRETGFIDLMRPLLIYIHGFNSSSQSEKATEVRNYLNTVDAPIDYLSPTFANYPGQAYQQLVDLITEQREQGRDNIALIGSSLGGFMATALAERYDVRAVLINPAVYPYNLIRFLLGENQNPYTGETFLLEEKHIDELHQIEVVPLTHPERLWVLLQTGDDLLNYRDAESYYQLAKVDIEEGGSHRFDNFERHLPAALEFLKLV